MKKRELRAFPAWLAACTAIGVFLTRWPFRSHALFSWDSANFALAIAHIDIAAHRPHPPGYLGYVLVARLLNIGLHDPNASLVLWNIIATALAGVLIVYFAWEIAAEEPQRRWMAVATALVFTTSPLLWFYSDVAEIYPSELLVVLLVAFTAWRTIQGGDRNIYWCVAALIVATVFKVTGAVLMAPLAGYAWTRVSRPHQRRSAALLLLLLAGTGGVFLILQPDLPQVVWQQFLSSTSGTRLVGGNTSVLKSLNRNIRDTLIATVSGFGVSGFLALVVQAVFDRRLPPGLGRRVATLWLAPWVLVFFAIHVAKPGYVLPVMPLGLLVLADFYARRPRPLGAILLALHLIVNVGQFVWLSPPSRSAVEASTLYRNKTPFARVLSDTEGVAGPTAFTIALSDLRVAQLRELVTRVCPSNDPIVVAGLAPVDWRRVMWYFPSAKAIDVSDGSVLFVGTHTNAVSVTQEGISLTTRCPLIWLAGDTDPANPFMPTTSIPVPHLGAMTAPGTVFVTPTGIRSLNSGH